MGLRRGSSSDGSVLREEGAGDLSGQAALPQQRPGFGPALCDVLIEGLQWSHLLSRLLVDVPMGRLDAPLSLRGHGSASAGAGTLPGRSRMSLEGSGPVSPWRTDPVSPSRTFILKEARFHSLSATAGPGVTGGDGRNGSRRRRLASRGVLLLFSRHGTTGATPRGLPSALLRGAPGGGAGGQPVPRRRTCGPCGAGITSSPTTSSPSSSSTILRTPAAWCCPASSSG